MFIETSAKTGENVEEVFVKCAKTILNKIESGAHNSLFKPILQGLLDLKKWGLEYKQVTFLEHEPEVAVLYHPLPIPRSRIVVDRYKIQEYIVLFNLLTLNQ